MARLDACGCCAPESPATPLSISNRPGLTAVAYRVGSFASFRETMLEALVRELPELTTRAGDDHAITLLELWAAVGDVLTFYQERIANEAFLRTAVDTESVRRLADLLGYQPRPGLSAEADIAFTLDEGAAVTLAPGLRLMSLPGAGEQPQTFETLEPCDGIAALNKLRAYPVPQAYNPLASGATGAMILDGPKDLAAGDRVVVFNTTALEEKSLTGVVPEEGARRATWAPALTQNLPGANVRRIIRPLRFFGWNAPETYPLYNPGKINSGTGRWDPPPMWTAAPTTPLGLPVAGTWPLEARVPGIAPGATLLVVHDAKVEMATVVTVAEGPATLGPLADTVTILTLSGVTTVTDRRRARILEIDPTPIALRPYTYPAQLTGGRITIKPGATVSLAPKRKILIDDGAGHVHAATVTGTAADPIAADHLAIDFTPALGVAMDADQAVMFGNVARAGHGETQMDENLGDGDGGQVFQSFVLSKAPVTRRPSARDIRGRAALDVLVDGVRWNEVDSLYGRRGGERAYTLTEEDNGKSRITFGDGKTGARLPSGRGNIVARYRKGLGLDGMVDAGKLSILLSRPPGLRDAINPAAAESGADPEDIGQARQNAPTSVRTFGRIVSIEDFAWLATASGEIAKAKATWVWRGLDRSVHLTVAAQGGGDLSALALERLHAALDAARDPNHVLLLANALRVPIRISAKLVVDPDRERDAVLEAARNGLLDYLSFARAELGRALHASQVITALQSTAGVAGVDLDVLHFRDATGWSAAQLAARGAIAAPNQSHLRLFAARPPAAAVNDPIAGPIIATGAEVVPAEIATLADADLVLSATGGIG
jgi:predicted phage baseplate assembly protein